jgi:hypothetical protein
MKYMNKGRLHNRLGEKGSVRRCNKIKVLAKVHQTIHHHDIELRVLLNNR